ncbi:MAG: hypothetical protein AAGC56_15340 [Pseudomonadota bacterium]
MTAPLIPRDVAALNRARSVRLEVRASGGAYGWLTDVVEAVAVRDADGVGFALRAPRETVHFIALVAALMGPQIDDPAHRAAFAAAVGRRRRRDILAAFAPDAPRALAHIAPKLAGPVWRAPTYRRLAALTADPATLKVLRHARAITRRFVLTASRLPPSFRTVGIIKLIRRPRDVAELRFAVAIVRRLRPELSDRQLVASLEKTRVGGILEWTMRHYEAIPFPPAPTGALSAGEHGPLVPLSSYGALAGAAREFRNCIRSYMPAIHRGNAYFYRLGPEQGRGLAIVELRRLPAVGWVMHDVEGPQNAAAPGTVRCAVEAAFEAVGVGSAPKGVYWGDLVYDDY